MTEPTVTVFVETPLGSRNKYEWDHQSGEFFLDRMLFSAVHFPGDYGFVPETWAEDGDPLDAPVIPGERTFPGCRIRGRVVGVFRMADEEGPDHKLITVPHADPHWRDIIDVADVPEHTRDEIQHFFSIYKELEGIEVTTDGFGTRREAIDILDDARDRYRHLDPQPVMPSRRLPD